MSDSHQDPPSTVEPVRVDSSLTTTHDTVERYVRQDTLGEGGMGEVRQCFDPQIGRRVALKTMRADRARDEQAELRFVREARIQGQLEHPSVPPVYDLGRDADGRPYFTMKRVHGVTLKEALRRLGRRSQPDRTFTRRRLLAAFSRVCQCVDYAHRRGVLHRDLKPANIMLGDFGEVTVLDWGVARVLGDAEALDDAARDERVSIPDAGTEMTRHGKLLGTPGYVSPEQIGRPSADLSPASDVYSLGAILFEILTLEKLHPGDAETALLSTLDGADATASRRTPSRDIPPELDAICVRATALDPKARFADAGALADAIEAFLDGERDEEHRARLATRHAERALAVLSGAGPRGPTLDQRRSALGEIGRALALSPGEPHAIEALQALASAPLSEVPEEVRSALQATRDRETRRTAALATGVYLSILLYLPFLIWSGVRSWPGIIALYALTVASAAVTFGISKSSAPKRWWVLACMLLSNAAFAQSTVLFGPLIVMPGLIAVNTTAYALLLDRAGRAIALGSGFAFVLAPALIEMAGASSYYAFGASGMQIVPNALDLNRLPSLLLLLVVGLATIATGALTTGRMRGDLADAELRLQLGAWQLRQLAPRPESR